MCLHHLGIYFGYSGRKDEIFPADYVLRASNSNLNEGAITASGPFVVFLGALVCNEHGLGDLELSTTASGHSC